jgi:glycosyltransferase involved in cell wall biosynthesis
MSKPKLLYLVTEDWYFWTHRFPLAVAALAEGYEVVLATNVGKHCNLINEAGIRVIPLRNMRRSSMNIFRELAGFLEITKIFITERPRLVHLVALKPVIYGSIAAKISGKIGVINALGGLGHLFSSQKSGNAALKWTLLRVCRWIFNRKLTKLILQNDDDLRQVSGDGAVDLTKIALIRGAGVDLSMYKPSALPAGPPIVMLASRMLWDKGVGEFVSAAELLKAKGVSARFVLIGEPDTENPSSISRQQLTHWAQAGAIEWWGHRDDMPHTLPLASIVCLPSYYGEGVPKVLIEAMACARSIITTDMPGCRDLVHGRRNGILVKPQDPAALANAIETLITDPSQCLVMGLEGRKIAEVNYGLEDVIQQTVKIYTELLDACPR